MVPMVVEERDREINTGADTMTDSDFNLTDAEGLAAWFARAEANAAALRQRLEGLGREWWSPPPESVRGRPEAGPGSLAANNTLPATGKTAVRVGNRHRGRRR